MRGKKRRERDREGIERGNRERGKKRREKERERRRNVTEEEERERVRKIEREGANDEMRGKKRRERERERERERRNITKYDPCAVVINSTSFGLRQFYKHAKDVCKKFMTADTDGSVIDFLVYIV